MRRRTVHTSFGAVAAACAAIAIWYGVQLTQANRINAAIASANAAPIEAAASSSATTNDGSAASSAATPNNTPATTSPAALSPIPQAQLAHAISLAKAGKFTTALKAYKALLDAPDEVRLPALYNLGNLNMREALKNGQGEAQRASPDRAREAKLPRRPPQQPSRLGRTLQPGACPLALPEYDDPSSNATRRQSTQNTP